MALGKILNVGGLENTSPKTTQQDNRLRVAKNIFHARDNRIIPRYPTSQTTGNPANIKKIEYITRFDNDVLMVGNAPFSSPSLPTVTHIPQLYVNNTLVPNHSPTSSFGLSGVSAGLEYDFPLKITSFRKGNITFFVNPVTGNFCKYDGVEVSAMGSPVPILGANYTTAAPTTNPKYLQVINHCIDFEGNEIVSESVKFPFLNTITSLTLYVTNNVYSLSRPANVRPILDKNGFNASYGSGVWTNTTPKLLTEESPYSESPFYRASGFSYNVLNQEYSITTTETNITQQHQVGSYVIVIAEKITGGEISLLDSNSSVVTRPIYGLALKVKSVSPLKLDAQSARYLDETRVWRVGTVGVLSGLIAPAQFLIGTRNILSVWGSASSEGVYTLRDVVKSLPYSDTSATYVIDTNNMAVAAQESSDTMLNISNILNDWYDVESVKISPNADIQWGLDPIYKNYGITTYQDLIISWSDDLIWYSDTTSPPSYEQFNALNFIKVGDTEFGKVITCCGTQDFLFVSREFKNYVVVGNIATGNYRVQELIGAEIGAWSPNASINVKDSAFFVTCNGIYQVANGNIQHISQQIPKNFNQFDNYTVSEDVLFKLDTTNVFLDLTKDQGIVLAYDEFRDLLLITRTGSSYEGSPTLVLNTRLGEFYEWDNLVGNLDYNVSAVMCMNSNIYVGAYRIVAGAIDDDSTIYLEDKTKFQDYASESPIEVYSTWINMGEPSLEKQLLQLKMFGYIYADSDKSLTVKHFRDWSRVAPITQVTYLPDSSSQYSHKQRLNSDKFLSVSVGFSINDANVSFELESMELEFNEIQAGVKK